MLNCTRSNKKLFTSKKFTNWLNFCNLDDSPPEPSKRKYT